MATLSQALTASFARVVNQGKAANQWESSALMRELERQGGIKRVALGQTIDVNLDYQANGDAVFQTSGFAGISAGETVVLGGASEAVAMLTIPINYSHLADAKNDGDAQRLDLIKSLIANSKRTHDNALETKLFVGGGGWIGLDTIATSDGNGTVHGVVANTDTWWKNSFGTYTDADDIEAGMTTLWNACAKGSGDDMAPTLVTSGSAAQATFESTLQGLQRFEDASEANAGFKSLKFKNANYVFSPKGGTSIYMFNPKGDEASFRLIVSSSYFRKMAPAQRITGYSAEQVLVETAGNTITANRSRVGVLVAA